MPFTCKNLFRSVFVAAFAGLGPGVLCAELCPTIANAADQVVRRYLLDQRAPTPTSCIAIALAKLGERGIVADSQIFVRYLDFLDPDVQGLIMLDKDNVDGLFPAVKGLVKIGRGAIPALLGVLRRVDESYSNRRNATRTIRLIFERDSGSALEFLLSAAQKDRGKSQELLLEAASWLSSWCTDEERAACEGTYQPYTVRPPLTSR